MIKMIAVQCPQCSANLNIEDGRKSCFCTYCGTKIMIDDGSATYTYRKVDEARIKEAEIDEKIRLKELEIESSRQRLRHTIIKIWVIFVVAVAAIGILLLILSDITHTYGFYDTSSVLIVLDFFFVVIPAVFFVLTRDKKRKGK